MILNLVSSRARVVHLDFNLGNVESTASAREHKGSLHLIVSDADSFQIIIDCFIASRKCLSCYIRGESQNTELHLQYTLYKAFLELLILFFMYLGILPVLCMCIACVSITCRSQKVGLDPPEFDL